MAYIKNVFHRAKKILYLQEKVQYSTHFLTFTTIILGENLSPYELHQKLFFPDISTAKFW